MTLTLPPTDFRIASAAAVEFKASPEGHIEGYASSFGQPGIGPADQQGDIVLAGAYLKSLAEHRAEGTLPAMLWSHQIEEPIGRWTSMQEDSKGLHVVGKLNLRTDRGRDAFEHVKAGDAGAFSIGYVVPEGGREYAGKGTFHLKEIDLYEVSIVAVPADPRARITGVKSLGSKAEAIDMLRECGLSRQAAARFAAGGWKALAGEGTHEKAIRLAAALDRATQRMRNDQ